MSFSAGSIHSTLELDAHGYGNALDKAAGDATRFSGTTTTVLQAATNKQQAILAAVGTTAGNVNATMMAAVKRSAQTYELGARVNREAGRVEQATEIYGLASGQRTLDEAMRFRASRGEETAPEIRRAMASYVKQMRSEAQSEGVAESVQRALFGSQATINTVAKDVARDQVKAAGSAMKGADWTKAWGEENRQAKMMRILMGGGAIGAAAMAANAAAASITRVGDAMVRLGSGQITMEQFRTEMLRSIPVAGELGYAISQIWQWKDRVYIAQIEEATKRQLEHIATIDQLRGSLARATESYAAFQGRFTAEMSGDASKQMEEQIRSQAAGETAPLAGQMKSDFDQASAALGKLRGEKSELLAKQQKASADVDHAKTVDEYGAGPYSPLSGLGKAETALVGINNDITAKAKEIEKYTAEIADLTEKMKGLDQATDAMAGKRMSDAASEKAQGWLAQVKTTWGGFTQFGKAFLGRGDEAAKKASEARVKDAQSAEAEGAALTQSLMTPAEKWSQAITKAQGMFAGGSITQETYDRELARQDQMLGTGEKTPTEARRSSGLASLIQGGSAEAAKYQAELSLMTRGGDKVVEKEHLVVAKETLKAIQGFNAGGGGDVVMDITGGMA